MNALDLTLCSLAITGMLTCAGFLAVILIREVYYSYKERGAQ